MNNSRRFSIRPTTNNHEPIDNKSVQKKERVAFVLCFGLC